MLEAPEFILPGKLTYFVSPTGVAANAENSAEIARGGPDG